MSETNGSGPSSWRDVYTLVRDTREDILTEVGKLADQLTNHQARIETLESERQSRAVIRGAVRVSVGGLRAGILTAIAIAAFVISILK